MISAYSGFNYLVYKCLLVTHGFHFSMVNRNIFSSKKALESKVQTHYFHFCIIKGIVIFVCPYYILYVHKTTTDHDIIFILFQYLCTFFIFCRVVFHSQVPIVIHILFILALALAAFSRHSAKFQYLFVCVLDNVFRVGHMSGQACLFGTTTHRS